MTRSCQNTTTVSSPLSTWYAVAGGYVLDERSLAVVGDPSGGQGHRVAVSEQMRGRGRGQGRVG